MEQDNKESFLQHPVIASIIVTLLYYLFLIASGRITELIGALLGPTVVNQLINLNLGDVVVTVVTFVVTSFLFYLIIHKLLHYPRHVDSFKEYLYTIRLTRFSPLKHHFFIGISIFVIAILGAYVVALLVGSWNFDDAFQQILPPNSWVLFAAVIPGLFEEVVFRGIIATMFARKYSQKSAILGSSALFGVAHAVNVLSGADLIVTVAQVGYTFFIGILLAYVFFETDSLIPVVILHYLTASLGQFFVYALFASTVDPLFKVTYMVIGVGIVPMILGISLMKLLSTYFLSTVEFTNESESELFVS
ncbi:MAG: CPBP family intramembrane glutamic endopeptidase [Candidatus Hodarchaeales archaeon]|jgi:membrane protease YdiL (CAAX protease family)